MTKRGVIKIKGALCWNIPWMLGRPYRLDKGQFCADKWGSSIKNKTAGFWPEFGLGGRWVAQWETVTQVSNTAKSAKNKTWYPALMRQNKSGRLENRVSVNRRAQANHLQQGDK